jgi:signal transduction histidine kinase
LPVEIGLGYVREGSDLLAIATVTDASFRIAAEAEMMRALTREHEAVERLEALDDLKTTLLHAVSHELRTPLTSIMGLAATLERDDIALTREDERDFARRIERNARKLSELLTDLLDLERLDRGLVEPDTSLTDVGALVRRVVMDCDTSGHPLHVNADPVVIAVDRPKVERMVDNLLTNAVKHTPVGTEIWVQVHPTHTGGAEIIVEDAGSGVPAGEKRAIFAAFERGNGRVAPSPGLGIGLSLVSAFAELHGGRVWVEDRTGGGASFHIVLPASRPAPVRPKETTGAE